LVVGEGLEKERPPKHSSPASVENWLTKTILQRLLETADLERNSSHAKMILAKNKRAGSQSRSHTSKKGTSYMLMTAHFAFRWYHANKYFRWAEKHPALSDVRSHVSAHAFSFSQLLYKFCSLTCTRREFHPDLPVTPKFIFKDRWRVIA
jgi:hypothetical protein